MTKVFEQGTALFEDRTTYLPLHPDIPCAGSEGFGPAGVASQILAWQQSGDREAAQGWIKLALRSWHESEVNGAYWQDAAQILKENQGYAIALRIPQKVGSDALQPIMGWDEQGSPKPLTKEEAQYFLAELQAEAENQGCVFEIIVHPGIAI